MTTIRRLSNSQHESKVQGLFDAKAATWAQKYANVFRHRLALFVDELPSFSAAGSRVLDFGCGSGQYLVELARSGFRPVGVDISQEMIAKSRETIESEGLDAELFCGKLEDIRQQLGQFDAVICASVLEYVPDINQCLLELRDLLLPDGVILFTIPNRESAQRRRERRLKRALPALRLLSFAPRVRRYVRFLEVSVNHLDWEMLHQLASRTGFVIQKACYFDEASGRLDTTSRQRAIMLFAVLKKTDCRSGNTGIR